MSGREAQMAGRVAIARRRTGAKRAGRAPSKTDRSDSARARMEARWEEAEEAERGIG